MMSDTTASTHQHVASQTPKFIASIILGLLGIAIAAGGSRYKGRTVFAVGALLAGSLCFTGLLPDFVDLHPTPGWPVILLGYLVVGMGAMIGGIFAHLFANPALGASMGFAGVIVLLFIEGGTAISHTMGSALLLSATFIIISILGWQLARRNENLAGLLTTSIIGSLLMVCAVDLGAKSALLMDLTALLTFQWDAIGRCPEGNGCHGLVTLLLWFGLALGAFSIQAYRASPQQINQWVAAIFNRQRHPYSSIPEGHPAIQNQQTNPKAHNRQDSNIFGNFSGGPRVVNVVDLTLPDDSIPPEEQRKIPEHQALLQVLAGMFEDLTSVMGFQVDNALNQAEHLVILLLNQKRFGDEQYQKTLPYRKFEHYKLMTTIDILHGRLFENYRQWAKSLKVTPVFETYPTLDENEKGDGTTLPQRSHNTPPGRSSSQPGGPPLWWFEEEPAKKKLNDLLLWLLIWGEAGNLRHMPECLTFLYHKMAIYFKACTKKAIPMRQAGYFLATTVTPIYKVVASEMAKRKDHVERRNYDDFNEFFWKPECLKYGWKPADDGVTPKVPMVDTALRDGPKTFLEKRSWLGIMLAFRRLIDWHVITFHILVVLSFWKLLIWDLPYGLQLMSSAFLTMNFLGILWVCLEVWATVSPADSRAPAFQLKPEEIVGFIVRLFTRFVFLVYQAKFYSLSLQNDALNLTPAVDLSDKPEQLFYWWQFLWVSLLLLSIWLLDCIFQVIPSLSTAVFDIQNDHVRAVVDIILPQGRNYTGKKVHETERNAILYMIFWATLVAWKLWFSYNFEVGPIALPSLELSDDLLNYLHQNVFRTITLIIIRWLPFAVIYMLDMLIWYSMWAGLMGLWVGLGEKLGQIRDFKDVRSNFMRTPEGFFSRIIFSQDDGRKDQSDGKQAKRPRRASNASDLKMPRMYSKSRDDLLQVAAEETTPLVANSNGPPKLYHAMSSGEEYLDVATSKWQMFAIVWNKVVENLRRTDVISNDERDMLLFHFMEDMSKPIYLPVFQTAGSVERAVNLCLEKGQSYRNVDPTSGESQIKARKDIENSLWEALKSDVTVHEAVSETMELGMVFLERLLGKQHQQMVSKARMSLEELLVEAELGCLGSHPHDQHAGGDVEVGQSNPRTPLSSGEHHHHSSSLLESIKLEEIGKALPHLGAIVSTLKSGLPKRVINKTRVRRPKAATQAKQQGKSEMVKIGQGQIKKSRSAGFLGSMSSLQDLAEQSAATSYEEELDSLRDKVRESLRSFLSSLKSMIDPTKRLSNVVEAISNILQDEAGFMWDDYYASVTLDDLATPEKRSKIQPILAKLQGLLTLHVADAEPLSAEARRRLTFFVNSLFMDIPKAPSIQHMLSWTVVTPYYSEDVLYSRKDLDAANSDGVNTLLYLQTLYKSDWKNFQERLGIRDDNIWSAKFKEETRLWASLRAQTLARTVQGMMYYEDALKALGDLDRDGRAKHQEDTIKQKFGYVVACQVYGKMKKNQDSKAEDIEQLLHRFPSLRVAYIDEVRSTKSGEVNYFSVLIRASAKGKGVDEIYRVKLPGNPVLGEGKPENQNHAVIFTRGEHVQAIDMNQEGYFEDAFKMRNFLQEFITKESNVPTTILGFREHIFTGAVSSLANYMALQEFSFVTLGQRVLNRPLRMRLHYGHPDLFDKLFFMQNGGISKASKGINLSEDIFAGYNNVLRGGSVEFKEYVQVGKGRDVGFQQIYKFEAKLSQGAAEQSISRDVYRMLNRVDFFRLMSFYFGGIGHYLSSVLTVTAIWLLVYLMLGLALFEDEKIGDRPIVPEGLLQLVLAGIGILQTVPLFCTLVLERGMWASLMEIAQVFLSGGPIYFIFHIRTRDYYYTQTVLAGGATYRATGRGFVTHHSPFDENYRFFANSHFYLGFEIGVALVLLAIYTTAGQYAGRTWSLWIAALAFLFAPFWFNPLTFEWDRVREDYYKWTSWMSTTGGAATNSWDTWWKEENGYITKLSFWSKFYLVLRSAIYLMVAFGLIYRPLILDGKQKEWYYVLGHVILLLVAIVVSQLMDTNAYRMRNYRHQYILLRSSKMILGIVILILLISIIANNPANIVYLLVLYYMVAFFATVALVFGFTDVRKLHRIHDLIIGHILFIPLLFFSALQFPRHIQTWLLYHNALSQGVVISDLIRYSQKTRESTQGDGKPEPVESSTVVQISDDKPRKSSLSKRPSLESRNGGNTSDGGSGSGGRGGGSGGGSAMKRTSSQKQQQQQQQQQQPAAPPYSTTVPGVFEFRQPTQFPSRG